jgi:hypothetical protein
VLGVQEYEFAPVAKRVTASPEHIVGLEGVMVIGLPEVVVTVTVADEEQPFASVPVTVYVVLPFTTGE